jgi:DedD protein
LDSGLKQRLVGAVVLVALAVIFLPMLLDGSGARERLNEDIAIPEQPEAPESRLDREGTGSGSGETPDTDTATLATDEFDEAAGASTGGGVEASEPEDSASTPQRDAAQPDEAESAGASADDGGDAPAPEQGWVVQVGSFKRETNALVLRDRLRDDGFDATAEQVDTDSGTLWRVWLGPVAERDEGEALERRIEDHRGSDALLMEYSR